LFNWAVILNKVIRAKKENIGSATNTVPLQIITFEREVLTMEQETQSNILVEETNTAPKKLLKSVSCIYIPCADPERTMCQKKIKY
jgi:hypothetical protein